MALVDSGNIRGHNREMSEHEWTLMLLKHGLAELAPGESGDVWRTPKGITNEERWEARYLARRAENAKRWQRAADTKDSGVTVPPRPAPEDMSQTPVDPSSEGLYARTRGEPDANVSQSRPIETPERRMSLTELAYRFTGKRTRKR